MYKKKPSLSSLPFSTLRKLSEAAETYQVDPLCDACDYQMRLAEAALLTRHSKC